MTLQRRRIRPQQDVFFPADVECKRGGGVGWRGDTHLPPGAAQVGEQQFDDVPFVNAEWGPAVG